MATPPSVSSPNSILPPPSSHFSPLPTTNFQSEFKSVMISIFYCSKIAYIWKCVTWNCVKSGSINTRKLHGLLGCSVALCGRWLQSMKFIIMRSLSTIFTSSCLRFKIHLLYTVSETSFSTKYFISSTNRSLSVCMHLLLSQNTVFICFFTNLI